MRKETSFTAPAAQRTKSPQRFPREMASDGVSSLIMPYMSVLCGEIRKGYIISQRNKLRND
jgi:hypothetical protein